MSDVIVGVVMGVAMGVVIKRVSSQAALVFLFQGIVSFVYSACIAFLLSYIYIHTRTHLSAPQPQEERR